MNVSEFLVAIEEPVLPGRFDTFLDAGFATWEMRVRFYVAALVLGGGVLFTADARPSEKIVMGAGLFCATPESAGQVIHNGATNETRAWPTAVDGSVQQCTAGAAAYFEREQVKSIQEGIKSFRVMRVTIIGFMRNGVLVATKPRERYIAILEKGIET
jgi:hypothetical protein